MRILLVVHAFPPEAVGGTEIYTHDLAAALASDSADEVFVLTRDADLGRAEYDVRVEALGEVQVYRINNTFRACHSLEDSYRNRGFLDAAGPVLDRIRPEVAHVQHLTCLSTELPRALASRGVPVVMTLNDYWLLCHRGQLLDLDLRRCPGPGEDGCARCIPAGDVAGPSFFRAAKAGRALPVPGAPAAVRAAARLANRFGTGIRTRARSASRLAHMRDVARHVDLFLAPSETLRDRFSSFGIPSDRLIRCNQGIASTAPVTRARQSGDVLRLVFAGSLLPTKAPHVLLEAAALLPAGTVTVDLVGAGTAYHGDDSYAPRLAPLMRQPFVRAYGSVPHQRVRQILAGADAVVVPSVWIENAPFIIKEAFASGLPVIASELGGMTELVTHDVNGLLFAPGSANALAAELRRLQVEPALLERLRSAVVAPMTIQEDAANLRTSYQRVIDRSRSFAGALADRAPDPRMAAVVLNYATPDQTWLAVRSLESSFVPPDSIVVVDNGSPDGSGIELKRRFASSTPQGSGGAGIGPGPTSAGLVVIETDRNLGFAGGMNVGIRAALERDAELVLLVNSDAYLAPDATALLLRAARAHPEAGILAPLVVSRAEPAWVLTAGIAYAPSTGRMRNLLTGQPVSDSPSRPFEVPAVSGCVMLIRRSVLETAGAFDKEYFFSFEDVELCLRAGAAGFKTMCVPQARAYHEGGRSIGRRSSSRVYFSTRNHLRLASALDRRRVTRAIRGTFIVGLNTAYVLTSSDAPLFSGLAAVARGARDHLLGRYGPDPAA